MAGVSVILSGCSKQEPPAPATTGNQPSSTLSDSVDAAKKSAQDAAAEAQKQAGQIKESADAAVADAKKEAERIREETLKRTEVTTPAVPAVPTPPAPGAGTATAGNQSQVTAVLAQAKTLYTEKKYPEALAALGGLQNVTLTAEEQNMVNQLKTQISNALAAQGANEGLKSVGGLLQPKQ